VLGDVFVQHCRKDGIAVFFGLRCIQARASGVVVVVVIVVVVAVMVVVVSVVAIVW
jgi:hypothetical protein